MRISHLLSTASMSRFPPAAVPTLPVGHRFRPAASGGRSRRCSGVSTYQLLRFLGHPACGFLPACYPSHSSFFGKNSMCASTRSHSRFRYFRRASKCSRGTLFLFSLSISICILFTWVSIPLIQLYRSSSNLFILSSYDSQHRHRQRHGHDPPPDDDQREVGHGVSSSVTILSSSRSTSIEKR